MGVELGRGGGAEVGVKVERVGKEGGMALVGEGDGTPANKAHAMPSVKSAPTIIR
ncbi:MAG: hypothetical protein PVG11_07595 [Anaerolineae bacterium]